MHLIYMEHIYTGYYADLENMKSEDSTIDSFEFMQNKLINDISAYDFLHGYFDIFAYALQRKFEYPVKVIRNRDNLLNEIVHYYCETTLSDGRKAYIDVRGITTDFDLFISEFEDFIDKENVIRNTFPIKNPWKFDEKQKNIYLTANQIIRDYVSGYKIT